MKNRKAIPRKSKWPKILEFAVAVLVSAFFIGMPIWIAGFWTGWALAAWVHLGLVVFYTLILLFFGYGSCVEMGVLVTVIALNYALVMPTLLQARRNAERREHKARLQMPADARGATSE